MKEFRCWKCRALLAEEDIKLGKLEIVCRKCNAINIIDKKTLDKIQKSILK